MNIKFFTGLLILFLGITAKGITQKNALDKAAFYSVMATGSIDALNSQLHAIKEFPANERDAYEGALLMKKAGMVTKAKEKLSLFKAGRLKLEASIKKNKANAEFNFLRLIIQEHAPRVADYRKDIENDVAAIRSNYKDLSPVVQQAVNDYSKKSKVLNLL